eukprot:3080296-Rhodomonas_salina.1
MRCSVLASAYTASCLRAWHAISGTEIAYGATRLAKERERARRSVAEFDAGSATTSKSPRKSSNAALSASRFQTWPEPLQVLM